MFVIVIVSERKNLEIDDFNQDELLIIDSTIDFISDIELIYHDKIISFDYLIIDDLKLCQNLKKTQILIDDNVPVTNFYHQTSNEYIYYGNIEKCIKHICEGDY